MFAEAFATAWLGWLAALLACAVGKGERRKSSAGRRVTSRMPCRQELLKAVVLLSTEQVRVDG